MHGARRRGSVDRLPGTTADAPRMHPLARPDPRPPCPPWLPRRVAQPYHPAKPPGRPTCGSALAPVTVKPRSSGLGATCRQGDGDEEQG